MELARHAAVSVFPSMISEVKVGRVREDPDSLAFLKDLPPERPPRFWQADGTHRIAWDEYGDPEGRALIYAHGWPSSRLQARLLDGLAREFGMRVFSLDRPGIGQSSRWPGRTLESWPALVEAFADAQGIGNFALLGVSGGGPYVLATAAMLPHRVTASAVLCGAVPVSKKNFHGLHIGYRLLMPMRMMPGRCFSPLLALTARIAALDAGKAPASWIMHALPEADRSLLEENPTVIKALAASFREGVKQGGAGVLEDAGIYFQKWNIPTENIARPIRYWHGGRDANIAAGIVREFVARIPGAKLDVVPDEGHFSLAIHRAREAMAHLAAT